MLVTVLVACGTAGCVLPLCWSIVCSTHATHDSPVQALPWSSCAPPAFFATWALVGSVGGRLRSQHLLDHFEERLSADARSESRVLGYCRSGRSDIYALTGPENPDCYGH
jgi:hypothetical protein